MKEGFFTVFFSAGIKRGGSYSSKINIYTLMSLTVASIRNCKLHMTQTDIVTIKSNAKFLSKEIARNPALCETISESEPNKILAHALGNQYG